MTRTRSLRITDEAEDDLAEIWAFIAADNPQAASAFVHKLRERFERFFPSRARPRPRPPGLRPARPFFQGLRFLLPLHRH
ncbi:MAG: type II toxin-antitoxin system RelE/ParE family toxin [Gammaproteobacteria bacterium]